MTAADDLAGIGLPPSPTVAIVGDSVLAGLGVNGRSYGKILAERVQAGRFLRLARSTHTVLDAVTNLPKLQDARPDLTIVALGGSEGLVHAGSWVQRMLDKHAPKSWQGVQGLDPRPWYTGSRRERVRQKVTSFIKVAVKHIGIRLTGGYRRVEPEPFRLALEAFLDGAVAAGGVVVCVGVVPPDEKLFPRSTASLGEYNRIIREAAAVRGLLYVDPTDLLHRWDDFIIDHAHYNESGHDKVAHAVLELLRTRDTAPVA